jgi:hypothetical protein
MSEKTVKAQWDAYAKFLATHCSPEQGHRTRLAFYSGAFAMFNLISEIHHMTVHESLSYLEGLKQECLAFQRDVASGGA